jgi:hypothetical protein
VIAETLAALTVAMFPGTSVDISCPDAAVWKQASEQTGIVSLAGLTYWDTRRVILNQWVCDELRPDSPYLGRALRVVAHELAHAHGVLDESEAECWALFWVQDLAQQVFGVEFFTSGSEKVLSDALTDHVALPENYRRIC